MRFGRSWHRSLTWCFAILVVIAVVCIEYINSLQHQYVKQKEQESVREELSVIRSRLESLIVSDIYLVNSLPVVVATNGSFSNSYWHSVASGILTRSSHINSIFLAPDDVIEYVYPEEYQEFIGKNFRDKSEVWSSVQQAKLAGETRISDSIVMPNGEGGLVARVPIFMDPPFNQRYWGSASVVISLDSLLKDAGVHQFADLYHVAITAKDSQQNPDDLIYGEHRALKNAITTESVHFPYGNWTISASTEQDLLEQTNWFQLHSARLIGYSSLLLLCAAYFTVYRLYHQANQRSLHDELTGLPNRRYFMFTLKRQFAMARRSESKERFALLNIDLDKFKDINDFYGHDAGDKVLQVVGTRIQRALRGSDIVARVGGDEFLVLLPRVMDENNAASIVSSVFNHVCKDPIAYDHYQIKLQASIGYAMYQSGMESVEDILKLADSTMYQDKLREKS